MADHRRGPGVRRRPAVVAAGGALVVVALMVAVVLGRDDDTRTEPAVAVASTTTTPSSSGASTLPPTTAPPTSESEATTTTTAPAEAQDADAVALEFLIAVADEEIRSECRSAEYVVRRDHPEAQIRVGVLGDSLTVQTVAQLTADSRFDWTVVSVCGARVDHFAGAALYDSTYDLSSGLDTLLGDAPDIAVIALGTNDALKETYENRAVDHAPSIAALLDRTAGVRCRAWVDVHTATAGGGGAADIWAGYAGRFDDAMRSQTYLAGVQVLDWAATVANNDPGRVLKPDGVHLTEWGRTLRTHLIADALTGLANDCVLAPPPPTEPPPGEPPAPGAVSTEGGPTGLTPATGASPGVP